MDERVWRIVVLVVLVITAILLFPRRPPGRGTMVCGHCGFSVRRGIPACPRCGHDLDTIAIDLGRLERARRRGELSDDEYRRRRLALIRGISHHAETGATDDRHGEAGRAGSRANVLAAGDNERDAHE